MQFKDLRGYLHRLYSNAELIRREAQLRQRGDPVSDLGQMLVQCINQEWNRRIDHGR